MSMKPSRLSRTLAYTMVTCSLLVLTGCGGMKLVPADASSAAAPDTSRDDPLEHGGHEHGDGLEWEDLMPEINRASDLSNSSASAK